MQMNTKLEVWPKYGINQPLSVLFFITGFVSFFQITLIYISQMMFASVFGRRQAPRSAWGGSIQDFSLHLCMLGKFSPLGYSQASAKEASGCLYAAYNMHNYSTTVDKWLLDPGTGWAQVSGYHCAD